MVTCGRQPFNMLPMAPINPFVVGLTPSVAAAAAAASLAASTTSTQPTSATASTKPKLAFSIDSIVGESQDDRRSGRTCVISPPLSSSQRSESPEERERGPPYERSPSRLSLNEDSHSHCQQPLELRSSLAVSCRPADGPHLTAPQTPRGFIFCRRRSSLDRSPSRDCGSPSGRCRSRSPLQLHQEPLGHGGGVSRSPTPNRNTPQSPQLQLPSTNSKGPLLVPGLPAGLIRPLAIQPPPNVALVPTGPSLTELGKPLIHNLPPHPHQHLTQPPSGAHPPSGSHPGSSSGLPPTIPPGGVVAPPAPPPNPHFLAAQFQMAAALAHHHQQQQQQHHPPPHLPPGHPMGIFPPGPHHPHFGAPHLIRDSYPLYPWLLSRHGRIFPHRFPGNFLLQPFRKPKRVRTAFSPTQLLKLEHAFEGNHYVVGAERKQLAQGLSLTETQVKVWFQNRRTKHKRMQQEGDSDSKSNKGSNAGDHDGKNDSSQNSFEDQDLEDEDDIEDEDEVIDMDDYGSEMDAEEHQRIREQFQQQLQQHQHQMQQHMQQSREQHGPQQLSQQQQQQMLQQHHHHQQQQQQQQQQQFMQHQLYLQQQQQQQQQQQPKQP